VIDKIDEGRKIIIPRYLRIRTEITLFYHKIDRTVHTSNSSFNDISHVSSVKLIILKSEQSSIEYTMCTDIQWTRRLIHLTGCAAVIDCRTYVRVRILIRKYKSLLYTLTLCPIFHKIKAQRTCIILSFSNKVEGWRWTNETEINVSLQTYS
jgi:hypothetical protein